MNKDTVQCFEEGLSEYNQITFFPSNVQEINQEKIVDIKYFGKCNVHFITKDKNYYLLFKSRNVNSITLNNIKKNKICDDFMLNLDIDLNCSISDFMKNICNITLSITKDTINVDLLKIIYKYGADFPVLYYTDENINCDLINDKVIDDLYKSQMCKYVRFVY